MNKLSLSFLIVSQYLVGSYAYGALNLEQFKSQMTEHVKKIPKGTKLSLEIALLGKEQALFSLKADNKLVPASAMKLLTSVAALDQMGPGFSFKTSVGYTGKREGSTVKGDLVIKSNGDPFLVSERLWLLARDVARSGVKNVRGGIRVDNGYFSGDSKDLLKWSGTGEKFATIVSATSFNFNSAEIHIRPVPQEKRVLVEAGPTPHDYAIIRNQLVLTSGKEYAVTARPGGMEGDREVFIVEGRVGRDVMPKIEYVSVSNPASYIAHAFTALLRKEGLKIDKDFVGSGRDIDVKEELASIGSLTLLDLVRLLNTFSNNFMTEQVFQALGAQKLGQPATPEKSRRFISQFLESKKICSNIIVDNGSGLSWESQVDAKCFVDLLQKSYRDFRVFADLIGSMPVGGSTGTLKNRFRGLGKDFDALKVRAKTGTLWSKHLVTSLVGFTQSQSGEAIVFAMVLNNPKDDSALLQPMRDWEDKCVEFMQQLSLSL